MKNEEKIKDRLDEVYRETYLTLNSNTKNNYKKIFLSSPKTEVSLENLSCKRICYKCFYHFVGLYMCFVYWLLGFSKSFRQYEALFNFPNLSS